jgi:exopolyphosphatase / guanosine-5'-triphosphate,3'-diphosphate pyrophosphatase
MEKITPRWEWRTFGDGFGDAEQRLKAFTPDKVRESAEIYILSAVSNDNTKIRDMLMDIKTLQQVNEDGLEQWKPIMKGSFPLHAEEIVKVFAAFRVAPQPFRRDTYTLEEFIGELVKVSRHLRAVDVRKKRTGYLINSCIAEMADVTVGGVTTRTIAIEAEDPAQVIATVRQLGLDRFTNINYLRGLKSLVHMTI